MINDIRFKNLAWLIVSLFFTFLSFAPLAYAQEDVVIGKISRKLFLVDAWTMEVFSRRHNEDGWASSFVRKVFVQNYAYLGEAFFFTLLNSTDPKPAQIFSPTANGISNTSTKIQWLTDKPSSSIIHFSPHSFSSPSDDGVETMANEALTEFHEITLNKLQPDTAYYYTVSSRDGAGNFATVTPHSFTTLE